MVCPRPSDLDSHLVELRCSTSPSISRQCLVTYAHPGPFTVAATGGFGTPGGTSEAQMEAVGCREEAGTEEYKPHCLMEHTKQKQDVIRVIHPVTFSYCRSNREVLGCQCKYFSH